MLKDIKSKPLPYIAGALLILVVVVLLITSEEESYKTADNYGFLEEGKANESLVSYRIDEEGNLIIEKGNISKEAEFIDYDVNGIMQQIFVVRAEDDSIRVAFNTCQVCNGSPRAYFTQSGDVLTCQNCGNRYLADQVGLERGGCNPIPIIEGDYENLETTLEISGEFMKENEGLFKNWKNLK